MDVTLPARGVRIGGVTVAPGEARAVAISLAERSPRAGRSAPASGARAVPAELVVGAGALLSLGAPRGGRRAALTARGDLGDPRVRRLAAHSGALLTRASEDRKADALTSAAAAAGVVALELSAAESPGDEAGA